MRPLRLILDGFGSYRRLADADFSDVDLFALTGPTGAGKSTVIDALCFALYGTVPRWGKENVIADALAPSANSCRVCLVFETAGSRYAAVRALARSRKGQVNTKEARLERLDPSVPASAPPEKILEASVEQIAEGPDRVTSCVANLLGLSYEHFTQSVLLPQGRFAEFLRAKPRERQDLLVQLLALGVYEQVGQRARERAQRAAERLHFAVHAREELAGATAQAEALAADGVAALARLAGEVGSQIAELEAVTGQARSAEEKAAAVRAESARLAALRMPAGVADLAKRIGEAEARIAECAHRRAAAELREAETTGVRERLPDLLWLQRLRDAHQEQHELTVALRRQEAALDARVAREEELGKQAAAAEHALEQARDAMAAADRAHAAAALAERLRVGEMCPVCRQTVAKLPQHTAAPARGDAKAALDDTARRCKRAQAAYASGGKDTATARSAADVTMRRLAEIAANLAQAPAESEVTASLSAITAAEQALAQARREAQVARTRADAADRARAALADDERMAWAGLRAARDKLVELAAPPVDEPDLAIAWAALTEWAAGQLAQRGAAQRDLDAAAGALQQQAAQRTAALDALLAQHGIGADADVAQLPVRIAEQRAHAEQQLAALRRDRRQAAKLAGQIAADREEQQVATMLGNLLRANSFERWLCAEALDSLVTEASATLMELSGGQYQLDRDDRNDLIVIDYGDAGARRPVHTLSGGETFQASLALALALSHQVIALSAGMRDLNSMFLDEGFGTLDEDSLDTVATTLERLAADSDRMVGIVTHVPALAERVPVRFVVSREGATSVLRKERV